MYRRQAGISKEENAGFSIGANHLMGELWYLGGSMVGAKQDVNGEGAYEFCKHYAGSGVG